MRNKAIAYVLSLMALAFISSCEEEGFEKLKSKQIDPSGTFTYTTDGPNTNVLIFTVSDAVYAKGYEWDFGDGETSVERDPIHTYSSEGDYDVKLTIIGDDGTTPFDTVQTVTATKPFKVIEVTNGDFASPGDQKYTNWTNVPGWSSDIEASDSGVEAEAWWMSADNNDYSGYSYSKDTSTWNLTDHTIVDGELFKLSVDGFDIWNGSKLTIALYYDSGDGTRNELASQTFDLTASEWNTLELSTTATGASVGAKIGIELKGDSTDGGDGWTGFDDVELFYKVP
ncbi:PKD domain-containing protein [Marinoscillum sp. MHG1-6]|uniref:PKD domain-containing protein n=1 Tax=Marinoscillum sp. MHG1-6 TaxID=2959627 RepID=UPI0021581B71|nr:PKD domain-containing protein [Marinoscillum sp. MHG1-6]